MSYSVKYTSTFDSTQDLLTYNVTIKQKDYIGDTYTLLLSGTPAIHDWQEDNPIAPIKGSSFTLGIITNHGTGGYEEVSLSDFFSNEDDTYLLEFKRVETDQMLFKGFLVQSDCSEIQIDGAHEITLSFTDNLGLLKDVTLLEAAQASGTPSSKAVNVGTDTTTNKVLIIGSDTFNFTPGQKFTVTSGVLQFEYTFVNTAYNVSLGGNCLQVLETVTLNITPYATTITWIEPINLEDYISLDTIVDLCLESSQLNLSKNVYGGIYPVHSSGGDFLEETYVDGRTFKNDDTYMSCYDVLQQIMERFNATCFQAHGSWYIIRWGEIFQYITTNGINFLGLDDNFTIGNGNDIVSGWMKSIERPYKYTQEIFDYVQLPNILANGNATILGDFRTSYTSGSDTIYEYELPGWYNYDVSGPYADRFIRITYDSLNREIERVIVVVGFTYSDPSAVQSNDILLNKGDYFTYSFDVRTTVGQAGPATKTVMVRLKDGTTTYYLDQYGQWVIPPTPNGLVIYYPSGDNTQNWHTLSINTNLAPIDGILNVYLGNFVNSGGTETLYKNISLEITNTVNGSNKIIGQKHNTSQNISTKNVNNINVIMDDGPLFTRKGCMFLYSYTGILRNNTTVWNYPGFAASYEKPLGFWTTFEKMYQNYNPTNRFEGTILKLLDSENIVVLSPKACFIYAVQSLLLGKRFVVGSLKIDYKHVNADLTLYEMADEDLTWSQVLDNTLYEFSYIYDNK